ncbi:hypothetical protein HS7_06750 [Sulfolobales archaeon HS-7]|nr:hypothetical protein HS7_06750 [Sulfolobales archaeon HS-7]
MDGVMCVIAKRKMSVSFTYYSPGEVKNCNELNVKDKKSKRK